MGLIDFFSAPLREPAECVIKVDGEEIAALYPYLTEVTVESSRERWGEASLHFESRRDERGRWAVQDEEVFVPWKRITIDAAFGTTTEPILEGFVQHVNATYPGEQGAATVVVTCRDASLQCDREHVRKAWGDEQKPVTDTEIVQEIVVGRQHLTAAPDNGPGQTGLIRQSQDCTDMEFLKQRARANGYELLFEGSTVYFGPMRVDEPQPQPTIMVYAGPATNCLNFSVSGDGHAPDQVAFELAAAEGSGTEQVVVKPDLASMGTTAADSNSAGLDDFVWRLSRQGPRSSKDEVTALAQAKANEFAMKVKAEGELDGSLYGHVLRVGHPVAVDGVGKWLGGIYYVDTVKHRFNTEGYRKAFTLLRNAYGDNL